MKIRLVPVLLAAASLLLTSCLPEAKNPLSTPTTSTIDSRLEGIYVQKREQKGDDLNGWHFHYRETSVGGRTMVTPWLEVLNIEHRKGGVLQSEAYRALTTHIGTQDYISFIRIGGTSALYSFARYEVNWSGVIRVWLASPDALAEAVKSGKLHGTVKSNMSGKDVLITDSTDRLAAFVAASDPTKLFTGKPLVLSRLRR
jgi:hypothetical protein